MENENNDLNFEEFKSNIQKEIYNFIKPWEECQEFIAGLKQDLNSQEYKVIVIQADEIIRDIKIAISRAVYHYLKLEEYIPKVYNVDKLKYMLIIVEELAEINRRIIDKVELLEENIDNIS